MPVRCIAPGHTPDHHFRKIHKTGHSKYFLLSLFLLIVFQGSFGAGFSSTKLKDTVSPSLNDYKLNREQFYETYGKDDSSRALIGFYFHKRNNAKKMTFVGAGLAITLVVIGGLVIANNSTVPGTVDSYGAVFGLYFLSICFYGSLALMTVGIVRWIILSRKKLMRLLEDYFAGKSIPMNISKSKLFNQWLKEEKNRHLHQ